MVKRCLVYAIFVTTPGDLLAFIIAIAVPGRGFLTNVLPMIIVMMTCTMLCDWLWRRTFNASEGRM